MPHESQKAKKARTIEIISLLKENYPTAKCSLNFKSVHQLMVATILSAQCTDERVNKVNRNLFKKYKSVKDFAKVDILELENDVRSTGFFRNKAKSIKLSAQQLLEEHHGRIPKKLNELTKLAGVGRKTGSVILGAGFGMAEGVVVDTHVGRISRLLGLTKEKDPGKVEKDLMSLIPENDWIAWSHLLIFHGRSLCIARHPKCGECFLSDLCEGRVG